MTEQLSRSPNISHSLKKGLAASAALLGSSIIASRCDTDSAPVESLQQPQSQKGTLECESAGYKSHPQDSEHGPVIAIKVVNAKSKPVRVDSMIIEGVGTSFKKEGAPDAQKYWHGDNHYALERIPRSVTEVAVTALKKDKKLTAILS